MRSTTVVRRSRRRAVVLDGGDLELWKALIRVSQLLPRALDDELAEEGSSLAVYEILAVLADDGAPMRMNDLGALALVSKPRLSVYVRDLEAEGLVARRPDPTDGRATLVVITAAGRQRLRQLAPVHLAAARAVVDRVPNARRRPVLEALAAILDQLGDTWHPRDGGTAG
jgi:DNA-binding MarR family transcriptional regulator